MIEEKRSWPSPSGPSPDGGPYARYMRHGGFKPHTHYKWDDTRGKWVVDEKGKKGRPPDSDAWLRAHTEDFGPAPSSAAKRRAAASKAWAASANARRKKAEAIALIAEQWKVAGKWKSGSRKHLGEIFGVTARRVAQILAEAKKREASVADKS